MIPSFLLALREGLEAALIIGIVLATLQKINRTDLHRYVWIGTGSAVILSLAIAAGLFIAGSEFTGTSEVIFEGTSMLLAAGMLTWMIIWMQKQSTTISKAVETNASTTTRSQKTNPILWLAFFAVLREGVELALFLIAASVNSDQLVTLIGALTGLGVAVGLGWLLNITAHKVSLKKFFQLTNVLMILFAAGLFAHGIHEFAEIGWIPAGLDPLYDISHILSKQSVFGALLRSLFGYNSAPMMVETIAYVLYLVGCVPLIYHYRNKKILTAIN